MGNQNARFMILVIAMILIGVLLVACDTAEPEPKSYTVGAIIENPVAVDESWPAFKTAMTTYGYTEGENITYFRAASDELLKQQVDPATLDLLVVFGGEFDSGERDAFFQAKALTAEKIPVLVAPVSGDPVAAGVADSMGQPGHNLTGIVLLDLDAKRFEFMIRYLPPDAQQIAVVYDADLPEAVAQLPLIETLAESAGLELALLGESASDPASFAAVFEHVPDDVDAVFLVKTWGTSARWFQWAFEHSVPSVQDEIFERLLPQPMLSYGPSFAAMGEQAARIADQILDGADAGTLPFEQPDLFLSIDLTVAEAIGFEIPDQLLRLADEIRRSDLSLYETSLTGTTEAAITHEPGTGACSALITTMAGTYTTCLNIPCAEIQDDGGVTYSEKMEVGACTHDHLVGICATAEFDMYYYNSDPSLMRIGCGFMGGNWQPEGETGD